MKFENDYFRIIIEKKQLSQERKEAQKVKWRKRRPAIAIALLLVVAIVSGTLYAHFRPADAEMQQASAQSGEGVGENQDNSGSDNNDIGVTSETGDEREETQEYGQVAGEYVTAAHPAAVRDLYLVSDKHIRAGYGDRR